jgi:hypothetical protein
VRIQQVVRRTQEAVLQRAVEEGSLEALGRMAFEVAVKAERREQAPVRTVG